MSFWIVCATSNDVESVENAEVGAIPLALKSMPFINSLSI